MSWFTAPVGVMFVAPDIRSRGGIAKTIENYQQSAFWKKYNCVQFSTYQDFSSRFARIAYSLWRYVVFLVSVISFRPAVVSVHTADKGSFYRKLGYILLSRICSTPVVIHIHPSSFWEFYSKGKRLRKFIITRTLRLCDCLIFLSGNVLRSFQEVLPEIRMTVLPNPVDVEWYQSQVRLPAKGNYRILFLGWIIKAKGVYDIVEIIPNVIAHFPKTEFLFAGNKEIEQLKKIIEDRHLSRHAKVLGWVDGKATVDLLRTSRLLLLPSYTEGVPNVILEAMASGLPVITTPVGGIPSVFVEGENGHFVPPGNTRELASRLIQMLGDDEGCEKISNITGRRARDLYSIEVVGHQLEDVYKPFVKN